MHCKFQQLLPTKIWVKNYIYLKPRGKYWTSFSFVVGELQSHFLLTSTQHKSRNITPSSTLKEGGKKKKRRGKRNLWGLGREGVEKKENQAAHPGTKTGCFLMDLWQPFLDLDTIACATDFRGTGSVRINVAFSSLVGGKGKGAFAISNQKKLTKQIHFFLDNLHA